MRVTAAMAARWAASYRNGASCWEIARHEEAEGVGIVSAGQVRYQLLKQGMKLRERQKAILRGWKRKLEGWAA